MSAKHTVLLDDEMKRCMAELDTLQCRRDNYCVVTKVGDWSVTGIKGGEEGQWNSSDKQVSKGSSGKQDDSSSSESSSDEDQKPSSKKQSNRQYSRSPGRAWQGKVSKSPGRDGAWQGRASKSPGRNAAWQGRESKSPRGRRHRDGTKRVQLPEEQTGLSEWVKKLFGAQGESNIRSLLLNAFSSGTFVGKVPEYISAIFEVLSTRVINESKQIIAVIKNDPSPAEMRHFGLAMIISSEHLRLRGLRAHIMEEMLVFVEYFEQTSESGNTTRTSDQKYLEFMQCYNQVADPHYNGHAPSVKMTLRSFGIDIARKMLVMGTHLVEIIVALEMYKVDG